MPSPEQPDRPEFFDSWGRSLDAAAGAMPAPDASGLEAVVQRAERRRIRILAGGCVLALAAGLLGAGVVTATAGSGRSNATLAAGGPTTTAPAPSPAPLPAGGGTVSVTATGIPLTPLFVRDGADGIAVRAYRAAGGPCGADGIMVEVSNAKAVAVGMGSDPGAGKDTAPSVKVLGAGTFGASEGQPGRWAAVRVGGPVAKVRLGADEMVVPNEGIAVLATGGDDLTGSIIGLDSEGKEVASTPINGLSAPFPCAPPSIGCPDGPGTAAGGSGTAAAPSTAAEAGAVASTGTGTGTATADAGSPNVVTSSCVPPGLPALPGLDPQVGPPQTKPGTTPTTGS